MIDKYCTNCGEVYPLTAEFWHRNKNMKDGFAGWCKKCLNKNNDITRGIPVNCVSIEKELSRQGIPQVKMKKGKRYRVLEPAKRGEGVKVFEGEVIQVDVRHVTLKSRLGFAETFLKWDLDKWGYKEV